MRHSSTCVEMLVPRRKGQLIKLLILVPLSLLLATSIYYQFYYELSSPSVNSISAPLIYEPDSEEGDLNQDSKTDLAELDNERDADPNSIRVLKLQHNSADADAAQQVNLSRGGKVTQQQQLKLSKKIRQQRRQWPGKQPPANDLPIDTDSYLSNSNKLNPSDPTWSTKATFAAVPYDPNGPGENGKGVTLKNLTSEQEELVKVGFDSNAFNQYVSDLISVNRSLPDVRDPICKGVHYPPARKLPPTSVIICFHNEAWSVLLRTVHSVLNRSPQGLIKEIILVDDYSNKPHLGQQLDDYVKPLEVVKVVRAEKREGLIRARLLGAKVATGPVLTFLDSHCECAEGWLEPLLARIYEDSTAVVCPVIDVISDKTFEYFYKGSASAVSVGGFDWNLQFNWHAVPDRELKRRKHTYDPIRSPTMAGGLFSIDKKFFERLGTYDSGFDIWGGENLELSFKTWMCGGTLEIIPCSHVGHVFRTRSPYKWRTGVNVLRRNSVRLAEVWLDEYKEYYYERIGHETGEYGDISERVELRKKLNCKPFSYFINEVFPEMFVPSRAVGHGEVRNEADGDIKMCLDSPARSRDHHKQIGLYPCHHGGGNQFWLFSKQGEIRRDESCVDYAGRDVILFPCHGTGGNQQWLYDIETKLLRHATSGRCMELARDRIHIAMSDCDSDNHAQKWTIQNYNATRMID